MKEFEKLTEKQILNLSEEDLNKYFELEMAKKGIPFLSKPIEPDYEKISNPDLVLYTLPRFSLYCTDEDIMSQICNILENNRHKLRLIDYEYSNEKLEYEKKELKENIWDNNTIGFKTNSKTVYSADLYLSQNDILQRNKKRQETYEKLCAEFEEVEVKINDSRAYIYDKYNEIRDKFVNISLHKNRFKKYLELSNNDKLVALKFYKDAYDINEEIEEVL